MREKIRNLTAELQTVQQELCAELAFPDGTPRKSFLCADPHSVVDVGLLKDAVDQFRRVLWFYVDQTESHADVNERRPPQPERHRKNEPAHALAAQQSASAATETQQSLSFFDRLDLVIEGYLQAGGQLSSYRKPPKSQ